MRSGIMVEFTRYGETSQDSLQTENVTLCQGYYITLLLLDRAS